MVVKSMPTRLEGRLAVDQVLAGPMVLGDLDRHHRLVDDLGPLGDRVGCRIDFRHPAARRVKLRRKTVQVSPGLEFRNLSTEEAHVASLHRGIGEGKQLVAVLLQGVAVLLMPVLWRNRVFTRGAKLGPDVPDQGDA